MFNFSIYQNHESKQLGGNKEAEQLWGPGVLALYM